MGGKPPFCFLVEVANCWGVMDFDGALTPSGSSKHLFGGDELDNLSLASAAPALPITSGAGTGSQDSVSKKVNFEHAVGAAWNSLSTDQVEPIWNTGFWKSIFGNDTLGEAQSNQFKRLLPVGEVLDAENVEQDKRQKVSDVQIIVGPLFQSCVKSTDDVSWQEKREALLQKALKHWLVLALSWTGDIEFVLCLNGCDSANSQLIMLGDVFRGKAPSTLNKRANSMKILCNMLDEMSVTCPCDEPTLYKVLCNLRASGAPPSRGKGILEAIAFVRYTMGILECDNLLKGRRCWGAATSDEPLSRMQSSPLQVQELEKLHYILEHDQDRWNRLFCGTVLFMTYARARWSDAQHAVSILFDRCEGNIHYVEILTGHHKTMRALQHRHQLLPLIAPAVGVTNQNWASPWETVRLEMGVDMDKGYPLLPAPLDNGELGRRALDSQEAGKWLRALLELKPEFMTDRKVSSHSMKSTMLSYLAKRGIDMADRLLLGYHTSPFTMGLTYSRDGMTRPLQILNTMLSEIREKTFRPDHTRSGRLLKDVTGVSSKPATGTTAAAVKVEISDDEGEVNVWDLIPSVQKVDLPQEIPVESEQEINDACTETSCSDISSGEDAEPRFESAGVKTFEPPKAPEGYTMWQHTKSKILHLTDHRTPNVFECGRKPGAFHTHKGVNPRWDTGICWKCFKHK